MGPVAWNMAPLLTIDLASNGDVCVDHVFLIAQSGSWPVQRAWLPSVSNQDRVHRRLSRGACDAPCQ